MLFRILGPLQVRGPDGELCALEPRHERLLATLLLAPNQVIGRQHLIDAVWDDHPPATAARQLRNLVSALRRRLADAGAAEPVIVAEGSGYRIRVADGQVDAQAFAGHLALARSLLSNGQMAEASAQYRLAMALWNGPALAGCTGHGVEAAAARLEEQRLTALEQYLDVELQLGRHLDLVGELTELVATNPLRERLIGQLMVALHRSDRRADSLNAYQALRTRLADSLGIDPGPAGQKLYTAILRNDLGVLETTPSTGTAASTAIVPRQLPPPLRNFVGRADEIKDLTRFVDEANRSEGAVVIAAIGGTGGVGKTALAVRWAHQVASRFPDGQLFVNLRGFDPTGSPVTPAEAIRGFLEAFSVPAGQIPPSLEAQVSLYRSLLSGRKVLVVLDNARDVEQVRLLLPASDGCLAIVTSRHQLAGLVVTEGAHRLVLDLLTTAEAHELLVRHLGPHRIAAEPDAVTELVRRCAHLPLALAIIATRAATHPSSPLATFVDELAEARRRLDVMDGGDEFTQVRAVFSWSYQRLSAGAAKMFRLLGLHPGPDISLPAATSLAGVALTEARQSLVDLTQVCLITEHAPGRYAFHDLLSLDPPMKLI